MNIKEALAICIKARNNKDQLQGNCYLDLMNLKNDYIENYGQITVFWSDDVMEEFCREIEHWIKFWKIASIFEDIISI